MIVDYIKKEDLIKDQQYYCKARNFTIGTWNGRVFCYTREKFGEKFEATEQHWDEGAPFGTVKPLSRWGINNEV